MSESNTKFVVRLDNDMFYCDSHFVQTSQGGILFSNLKHCGFGDFKLVTPKGNINFDRRDDLKFDGFSGRTHLMTDGHNGELCKKLILALGYEIKNL